MQKSIEQILELDLTKEEKEALLRDLANKIIKNKPKTWETKNEELKEKSRKQAQEVSERQEKRNNEYALNYEIKRMEDELLKITNNRGEHICTRESLNELSLGELEELYYRYFGEHKLDGIHEKYYGTDNRDQDKAQEANKKYTVKRPDKELVGFHRLEEKDLDKFVDMMTLEEMNAVLLMRDSGKYDNSILNNISTRLGVSVSYLEEIAARKEVKFKEYEKNEYMDKDDVNESNVSNNGGSSSDNNNENKEEKKDVIVDTKTEKPKKVKGISKAAGILKQKINAKPFVAVAAIAATMALVVANPLAMGYAVMAGATKLYMDYNKGAR